MALSIDIDFPILFFVNGKLITSEKPFLIKKFFTLFTLAKSLSTFLFITIGLLCILL